MMKAEKDPVIRDETKRQTVILVFTIATVAIVYYIRKPDSYRTLRMASALTVKRFAQTQADMWQNVAGWAATMYNRDRA